MPEIIYAGGDHAKVGAALQPLDGLAQVKVNSYLPLSELAALCRSASVNVYIRNPAGFHHKLLELLACGPPVVAFPGETDESRRLAAASGGELFCPNNKEELVEILSQITARIPASNIASPAQSAYTWTAQALILEQVLHQSTIGSAA